MSLKGAEGVCKREGGVKLKLALRSKAGAESLWVSEKRKNPFESAAGNRVPRIQPAFSYVNRGREPSGKRLKNTGVY